MGGLVLSAAVQRTTEYEARFSRRSEPTSVQEITASSRSAIKFTKYLSFKPAIVQVIDFKRVSSGASVGLEGPGGEHTERKGAP